MGRRIWKIVKLTVLGALAFSAVVIAAGLSYRAYRHHEIARATAIDPVKGIDEEPFARIGGIEQWIGIRGQNRDNPVLLLVHGGPGLATSPFPRDFLFTWTHDFTVVRWDQRGAGKTFGRSGAVDGSVTVERMVQDGIEVADFARARLHKPKVVLVGHSWGSSLGVRMARARPDLFYAYVGTGQSVNQGKYKTLARAQLLAEASSRNDQQAIAELTAIGPPPYDSTTKALVHTKWANRYEPGQPSTWGLMSFVLFDSEAGFSDLRDYVRGIGSSEDHFRAAIAADDLPSAGRDFSMPFFVFQGAADNVTPVPPVRAYVDSITAPHKELVLIPKAGHNVMATSSGEFLKLLVDRVRPLSTPAVP